jgi:protein tyrosine/serine phosphatase
MKPGAPAIVLALMLTASNAIAGALAWSSSPMSGPIADAPIREYGIVDEGVLSRSGRPSTEGYGWLREHGVKAIVNLTEDDVDAARAISSSYLWLAISPDRTPTTEEAEQFLDFVQDSQHWPVHVHCDQGEYRTGIMVALVRYAIDGWPLERALQEARLYRRGKPLDAPAIEMLQQWANRRRPGSLRRGGP